MIFKGGKMLVAGEVLIELVDKKMTPSPTHTHMQNLA